MNSRDKLCSRITNRLKALSTKTVTQSNVGNIAMKMYAFIALALAAMTFGVGKTKSHFDYANYLDANGYVKYMYKGKPWYIKLSNSVPKYEMDISGVITYTMAAPNVDVLTEVTVESDKENAMVNVMNITAYHLGVVKLFNNNPQNVIMGRNTLYEDFDRYARDHMYRNYLMNHLSGSMDQYESNNGDIEFMNISILDSAAIKEKPDYSNSVLTQMIFKNGNGKIYRRKYAISCERRSYIQIENIEMRYDVDINNSYQRNEINLNKNEYSNELLDYCKEL